MRDVRNVCLQMIRSPPSSASVMKSGTIWLSNNGIVRAVMSEDARDLHVEAVDSAVGLKCRFRQNACLRRSRRGRQGVDSAPR